MSLLVDQWQGIIFSNSCIGAFYRLDNAGLTPEFKSKYFMLLEESRNLPEVYLRNLVKELYAIPNLKGQQSLQFSFVTKLANTVNRQYPIYDSEVGCLAPDCLDNELSVFMQRLRVQGAAGGLGRA